MTESSKPVEKPVEGIPPEEKVKIDAEYAKLEKELKDSGKHEMCLKTLAMLLTPDGQGYRDQWEPEIAAAWWVELDKTKADRSMKKAIDDLILLAFFIDQKLGKKNLHLGLLILLNEAVVKYQLVDASVPAQFDPNAKTQDPKVTGTKDRAIPAKVGEKAPEGAVRPDQLGKGPRRI